MAEVGHCVEARSPCGVVWLDGAAGSVVGLRRSGSRIARLGRSHPGGRREALMAQVTYLQHPFYGMDRIVNVTNRVGPEPNCVNDANDVEVVQRLLGLIVPKAGVNRLGFGAPQISRKLDALTCFYVYYLQHHLSLTNKSAVVDGCVSPAPDARYGSVEYTIVALNSDARLSDQEGWKSLLKMFEEGRVVGARR